MLIETTSFLSYSTAPLLHYSTEYHGNTTHLVRPQLLVD